MLVIDFILISFGICRMLEKQKEPDFIFGGSELHSWVRSFILLLSNIPNLLVFWWLKSMVVERGLSRCTDCIYTCSQWGTAIVNVWGRWNSPDFCNLNTAKKSQLLNFCLKNLFVLFLVPDRWWQIPGDSFFIWYKFGWRGTVEEIRSLSPHHADTGGRRILSAKHLCHWLLAD